MKVVNKIGFNDINTKVSVKGRHLPFYACWSAMLKRVNATTGYSASSTVCTEWLYLSVFKDWYDSNYVEGYELDKDLFIEGNTLYSPDTCFFVPKYLNNLFKGERTNQGDFPKGVHERRNGVYCAQIRKYGKKHHLGYFDSVESAQITYQKARRAYVLEALETWKNSIPQKLYTTLINREIEKCSD